MRAQDVMENNDICVTEELLDKLQKFIKSISSEQSNGFSEEENETAKQTYLFF